MSRARVTFRAPPRSLLCAAAAGAALSLVAFAPGCGDDTAPGNPAGTGTSSGTAGGGGGTTQPTQFAPPGCAFEVAPRPEYLDFSVGKTDVGASPNIRRVRLGLGGNVAVGAEGRADPATTAAFGWQTDDGTLVSEVRWGNTPDPSAWPAENRQGGITWLTPQSVINPNGDVRMHEAYVCGLTPDTTYYYVVGGGPAGAEVWSDVHSFKTTPRDPATEVTIAVSGDSRGEEQDAWRIWQRRVLASGADLQLFSGDVVNLATDQGAWEKWLDSASRDSDGTLLTLGQVLMLAAHGNHEAHSSLYFGNLIMPQDLAIFPSYAELFYSVDVGPVHIVVIDDAWIGFPNGNPEFAGAFETWLRQDLAAADANRAAVPWIMTVQHHSPYSSSNHGDDADVLRTRAFFVPIFDEYHVDLSINGHDHNYERSKPLTGPADAPTVHESFADGTVYMVCAGVGAEPYSAGVSEFTEISRDYKTGGAIGFYSIVTATQTAFRVDGHELRADGTDPVIDTFTIGQ